MNPRSQPQRRLTYLSFQTRNPPPNPNPECQFGAIDKVDNKFPDLVGVETGVHFMSLLERNWQPFVLQNK